MTKLLIINCIVIFIVIVLVYIIRLLIKHNLFVSKLIIKAKFLGIHVEIESKEKKHPSEQE